MKNFVLTVLLATTLFNANAQNFIGDKKDIDEITQKIAGFSEFVMTSDYDKIAAAYTHDGKIMPDGTKIIEGYEDIKKRWTLPEGVSIPYHKILPEEIKVIEDHAYDYGYYEGKTKRADGSEVSWKGKYVIVWRKEEGQWKIYLDIWNRVN